ncbi:hypothetical protein RRF57_008358 [Xylaria bambusicola]|uniref:Uncharacterized protein n=1 Tax=Xylaria bambusicola TaxID=326684 RepID=A0AAN7V1M9_9PEZI
MRMSDDGHLTGGEVDGKEIFTDAAGKASAPPDVLVGPDSSSILSFTSGTTSTPKSETQQTPKSNKHELTNFKGCVRQALQLSQILPLDGRAISIYIKDKVRLSKVEIIKCHFPHGSADS